MESSTTPSTIFFGGPVEPDGYICLTPLASSSNAVTSIDIETTSPVHIEGPHRVFRGYSGWNAQQLSDEIRNEGWFVVPSVEGDHFTSDPETLWNRVLARQVGELSRYGQFPTDPHQN
jgi:putative transcriptional regulator